MAKKYMGENDPALDALYEELGAIGTNPKTRADRRKQRQIERQIRKIRAGRLGGLGGLFENLLEILGTVNVADTTGMAQPLSQEQINAYISEKEKTGKGDILKQLGFGKVDDVWQKGLPRLKNFGKSAYDALGEGLMYQHISKPQLDQFADETQANIAAEAAGEEKPFPTPAQDVLGFGRLGLGDVSEAQEAVPIEEIIVDATKRAPTMLATEPKFDISSKLGRNQIRSIEKRRRRMGESPDAFRPDYAIEFLPDHLKEKYRDELLDFAATFSPHESQRASLTFDQYGRRTTPAGQYVKGGDVKKENKWEEVSGQSPFLTGELEFMPPIAGITSLGAKIPSILKAIRALKRPKDLKVLPHGSYPRKISWNEANKMVQQENALSSLRPTKGFLDSLKEREALAFMNKITLPMVGYGLAETIGYEQQKKKEAEKEAGENLEAFIAGNEAEGLRRENMIRDRELAERLALASIDIDGLSPEIQAYIEAEQASGYAHGGALTGQADMLSRAGRGDDTMLMHVTPDEVAGIASLAPGMMTINPETGLPEAGWFGDMLGFALPFLGTMVGIPPWVSGAIGAKLRGGDTKDMLLGGITGAFMGNLGKNLSNVPDIGATNLANEAATQALTGQAGLSLADPTAMSMAGDAFTKAGIDPTAFQKVVGGGMDPLAYLANTGVKPAQIASFTSGLSDIAKTNLPDTFGQTMKNIGAGTPAIKDALMSGSGIFSLGGMGLQAQRDMTRRFEEQLLKQEEERERRKAEMYAMYPENIPYRGGGSIYKNRYINGNWS